jgi:hypothetical protein
MGGHGYMREHGMEQLVRDCRISTIYEGTTQVQALDLLGRKTLMAQGKPLAQLRGASAARSVRRTRTTAMTASRAVHRSAVRRSSKEWQHLTQKVMA